jgi:spore photoproduct lyase
MGKKPYIRVYVNLDEILDRTKQLIQARSPEVTLFEGAAVSDPIPVERYTGSLQSTIRFFGKEEFGRFRFVTKFTDIDSLLGIDHNRHTTIRFSINSQHVIRQYEHGTPSADERIEAARKVFDAGYELGFLIAPIVYYPGWQNDYEQVLANLAESLKGFSVSMLKKVTVELISHRFTTRARTNIHEIFPATDLNMEETDRKFKYGQFGYGKYVYTPEIMAELKSTFQSYIDRYLPGVQTLYFV